MTVSEFIEELQRFHPQALVQWRNTDHWSGYKRVTGVKRAPGGDVEIVIK